MGGGREENLKAAEKAAARLREIETVRLMNLRNDEPFAESWERARIIVDEEVPKSHQEYVNREKAKLELNLSQRLEQFKLEKGSNKVYYYFFISDYNWIPGVNTRFAHEEINALYNSLLEYDFRNPLTISVSFGHRESTHGQAKSVREALEFILQTLRDKVPVLKEKEKDTEKWSRDAVYYKALEDKLEMLLSK